MKKFGFLLTLLIGIFFIFSPAIIASDVTITCDDSTCTPTTITDFFDPAIYWAPYTTQTSTITIQNTAGTAKTISIEADNGVSSEGDNLAEVIEFVIKKRALIKSCGQVLYLSFTVQEVYLSVQWG